MSKTYHASLFEHIHAVEKEHFWFVARNDMIREMVRRFIPDIGQKTFLDVGCGTGIVLTVLEHMGFAVTGLDVNARALTYAAKLTKSALVRSSIFQYRPKKRFSAIGAFDVMEHLPNDTGFLSRCHQLLVPGGYVFLSVPAGQYLWSEVDALSGHQRRYESEELRTKLQAAGFSVVFLGYWNSFLLPVYMLWRYIGGTNKSDVIQQYLQKPHAVLNAFLLFVMRFEQWIGIGRLPFGATLVVVGKKV